MKRLSHNNVELPKSSRKRPLSATNNNTNNTMMNTSPLVSSPSKPTSTSRTSCCKFQMKQILYSLVVVMMISSVLFVIRYHSITSLALPLDNSSLFLPHVRRRRRTTQDGNDRWKRPPSSSEKVEIMPVEYDFSDDSTLNCTMQNFKTMNSKDYCGTFAQQASQQHGFMNTVLLDKEAVVVISGILSPMGVSLALVLHQTCGVSRIIGVDSLLPNLRHGRMQRMEFLQLLQRNIPKFPRLIVPELGLPWEELFAQTPTHFVHFVQQYPTELETIYTFQQMLEFFLKQQDDTKKIPHVTYISTRDAAQSNWLSTNAVDMMTLTYQQVYGTTATTVGLRLPHVYGDYSQDSIVSNITMTLLERDNATMTTIEEEEEEVVFVDDAVDAIVAAMQISPPTGLVTLDISTGISLQGLQQHVQGIVDQENVTVTTEKTAPTENTATRYWLGWNPSTSLLQGASQVVSRHLSHKSSYGAIEQSLNVPTPPQRVEFPCASECARPASCIPTVFDKTIKVSRPLTRGCKYVVYTVDLWGDLHDLPSSGQPSEDPKERARWCRIAFVSSTSPLVQEVVKKSGTQTNATETTLESMSGKVQYKKWTLVFVHGNAANMSEAEFTLLKMTPKRFFSDTISRAMFVQPNRFSVPPYESLAGFFKSLDPSPKAAGRTKEYRPGVNIFRFLPKEAKKARRVIFSSLEATFPNVAEKSPIGVYVQDLVQREGIRPNQDLLVPQVSFYTYAAHFVQQGIRRPEYEMRSTVYKGGFPFQWLKTAMIVHDLRETESRNLRCEWYDEHLFWGNTHLEDVSLAYVLGKRRIMGRHDVSPEKEEGWFPIMDTEAVDEHADEVILPDRLTNDDDAELFVRILPKPKS